MLVVNVTEALICAGNVLKLTKCGKTEKQTIIFMKKCNIFLLNSQYT